MVRGIAVLRRRQRIDRNGGERAADLAAANAISLGTTFLIPIGTAATLLQPSTTVVQGIGVTNGAGEFETDLDIPQNPALAGVRINGLAVFVPQHGAIWASNLDSKVVQ